MLRLNAITYALIPADPSTPGTHAVLPRFQKTFVSPGAELGLGLLLHVRGCLYHNRRVASVPIVNLRVRLF